MQSLNGIFEIRVIIFVNLIVYLKETNLTHTLLRIEAHNNALSSKAAEDALVAAVGALVPSGLIECVVELRI